VLAWETGDVELLKFGQTLNANPEPSPGRCEPEGVETRRAAPKLRTFRRSQSGLNISADQLEFNIYDNPRGKPNWSGLDTVEA
jgi:hypothetical protein